MVAVFATERFPATIDALAHSVVPRILFMGAM